MDLLIAFGLTCLAYVHRVAFLCSNVDRDWPFTLFYQGDSLAFFLHARALLEGTVFDGGIPFHPPGFPYFLALLHLLTGAGPGVMEISHFKIKLLLAVVGSLPVGLLYLTVLPYLGRSVALLSAFLCVYHFGLYVLAVAPVSEGLYLALLLLSILLWSRFLDHPLAASPSIPAGSPMRRIAPLLFGIVLALMTLTRAEGALVAMLLVGTGFGGCIGSRRRGRHKAQADLAPWLLAAVGFCLTLAPWTVRNAVVLSAVNETRPAHLEPLPTFVPITLYGPLNLALANHSAADGTFSRDLLRPQDGGPHLNPTDPQHLEYLLHGHKIAWRFVRENPLAFARLVIKKWGVFFQALKLGWTQWNWPGGLSGIRRPVDVFVPCGNALPWRLAPLFGLGLLCCLGAGGQPRLWALLTIFLTACALAVSAVFFGYVRQGLLLLPLWFTLASAGILFLARWLSEKLRKGRAHDDPMAPPPPFSARPGKIMALFLVLAAFVLFALELRGGMSERNYRAVGPRLSGEAFPNPDARIALEVVPSAQKDHAP
ncbi:MAG: hypothetical protein JXL84_05155 [Deltaproteobacteria bacterium]|nr:hypothetical protein [Deltaproteobacteria bacterium]